MKTLIHLDSSLRGEESNSRILSSAFAKSWQSKFPDGKIIYRDLAKNPIGHLTSEAVQASYKPVEQRTPADIAALKPLHDAVDELMSADHILIAAPMYNFTVPSSIKAWVDHIVVDGRTFSFGANGPEGYVKGKKVFIISSHGGSYTPDSPWAAMNMLTPWLRNILGFLGMTDVESISIEGADFAKDQVAQQMNASREKITQLVAEL
ncbi:MAG: FMN-dependent NADH-azoreductase [Akkermansiaceae bacterium]|nr:FMN-dependent NADH-azoreductase [Akkermansiaceae bacterium]